MEVPVNVSTLLWYVSHSSQFCIICKHAEGAFCPIVQVISEDVKQYWPQYRPLGQTTSDRPPAGLCVSDHNPLSQQFSQFSTLSCPTYCQSFTVKSITVHLSGLYFITLSKKLLWKTN